MAASTLEELEDGLNDSLQWRRSELHAVKSDLDGIREPQSGLPRARALRRAAVALLYAHWEGYVRESCQAYLDYVARRRLKYGELSDAFLLLAVRRTVIAMRSGDPSAAARVVELVRGGGAQRASIERAGVVNTKSNLRYETLVEILSALGLPSSQFELKANMIDRSLCDLRNEIAHEDVPRFVEVGW